MKRMTKGTPFIRTTMTLFIVLMLMIQSVSAEETVLAPSQPSPWATWEVQMASIYQLGQVNNYSDYQGVATQTALADVMTSLELAFDVELDQTEGQDVVNRQDVLSNMYLVISQALEVDAEGEAIDYFVTEGLIQGRASGQYALEAKCTNEELLTFAKRTYEHIIYALDLDSKGAFWKVESNGNTVYLLGSIHVGDGQLYPLSRHIQNGFVASDVLVVEADINAISEEDIAYMNAKAVFSDGTSIADYLSEEVYEAYAEKATEIGLTEDVYNILKPWYAAMLLQNVMMQSNQITGTLGIDSYFLSLAQGWKPVAQMEGLKYQIDLFDSFSMELQEVYLAGTLGSEEETMDAIVNLLDLWKAGDTEGLALALNSDEEEASAEMDEFNDKLFYIRNADMTEKVIEMLEHDGGATYFVVLGAGHMVGETGIVAGLLEAGYEVIAH